LGTSTRRSSSKKAMRRFSLLGAVVLALLASGCLVRSAGGCNDQGGSCGEPTASTPTGELRGLVVVEGGPVMAATARPLKNARIALTVRSPTGETLTRHLTTDEHGNFGLRLQPGWYTLTAQFTLPLLPPQRVVKVTSGQVVRVQFTESIK
jgi:hypothetical protein